MERTGKSISDFKWCIDNDWQVYIVREGNGARIAIRKYGITTQGKDSIYDKEAGINIYSKETLGKILYNNQNKAMSHIYEVCGKIRDKYDNTKEIPDRNIKQGNEDTEGEQFSLPFDGG